jgi:catechol 2,3-dioxygenase-like lactoylglutathione lyase family enzyme
MTVEFQKTIPILRIFSVEKAKEFYVDYLGFSVDWEHHFEDNTPAYIQVSRDGLVLHLSEHHGDCCPGSTVFVWMTGIDEFHQQLSAKNYKVPSAWAGDDVLRRQVRAGHRPVRQPHPVQRRPQAGESAVTVFAAGAGSWRGDEIDSR